MNNGITPRGDVAGFYTDLMNMQTHGYIVSEGATTQVDFPGSSATRVWDLNPHREAVGFYVDPTTHVPRGFRYRKGHFPQLTSPVQKTLSHLASTRKATLSERIRTRTAKPTVSC